MAPRWRLEVEGLGRLERAEVDIHPLMLFVGPNNTGKSYLASLLWGLLKMQLAITPSPGPIADECVNLFKQRIGDRAQALKVELSREEVELFDRLFQDALAFSREGLLSSIFNDSGVSARALAFRNLSEDRKVQLETTPQLPNSRWTFSVSAIDGGSGSRGVSWQLAGLPPDEGFERAMSRFVMVSSVLGGLTPHIPSTTDSFSPGDPLFLPASRTGFMQLYKAATRRSLQTAFRPEADDRGWLDLTAPAFHFIDMLALGLRPRKQPGPFGEEADLLEDALGGRVELISGDVGINEYRYVPRSAQLSLSMSRSSSLVTELAPLVVVLRHLSDIPVLILEEPEAHLHIELQRVLAQVVVRLIRKGVYVWITTHSENFCQQINNFIKIGALDPARRAAAQEHLGYAPQDYLELDDVVGYQFKLDDAGQRSSVIEMEKTPYGLAMPTFNAAILRLTKDVDYLDQRVAGE